MKIIFGVIFLFLGLLMLVSSLKVNEIKINDLTQNRFMGVFECYDHFMKEHPIVHQMINFMNWTDSFKNISVENIPMAGFLLKNLNIIVSLLFIAVGIVLIINWGVVTPLVGAIFIGVAILAIAIGLRAIRLHLN